MKTYTTAEFLGAAHRRVGDVEREIARLDEARQEHDGALADARSRRDEALREIVVGLIPALTPEAIDRAVAATGAVGVLQADVFLWRDARRRALEARVAEIAENPAYAQRELRRAPRVGTLTRQVDELEEFRQPFADLVERAAHPRLARLLENGYGTDAYLVPFWRLSYYGDWKAGDEILERFPGKTFAQLREELATAHSTLAVYDGKLGELRDEIRRGEALEAEHDKLVAELAGLDDAALARARSALRRHLIDADLPSLGERLRAAPELDAVAKRWAGLSQKVVYLERMKDEQLDKPRAALDAELRKLHVDIQKYSRPKKQWERFEAAKFEKRFNAAPLRYRKNWDRYQRGYHQVSRFDSWDRGSFASDFLWWDVMTDGQLDGNFIPEVNEWRAHHPGYEYQRWRDDDADERSAAEAIAAATTLDPSPADGGVDVS